VDSKKALRKVVVRRGLGGGKQTRSLTGIRDVPKGPFAIPPPQAGPTRYEKGKDNVTFGGCAILRWLQGGPEAPD